MYQIAKETGAQQATAHVSTAPVAGVGSPAASHATRAADTVPKHLSSGEWTRLIERFNNITLAGEPRKFPEHELLGAEYVAARMLHEHTKTFLLGCRGI